MTPTSLQITVGPELGGVHSVTLMAIRHVCPPNGQPWRSQVESRLISTDYVHPCDHRLDHWVGDVVARYAALVDPDPSTLAAHLGGRR